MSMAAKVVLFNQTILGVEPRNIAHGAMTKAEEEIAIKCLNEEVTELQEAQQGGNIVKQVDALIDGIYFGLGALYKLGLTAEQIDATFDAVHDANMTKKRGVNQSRGDGQAADAIKPEGWLPPEDRIALLLGLPQVNPTPMTPVVGDPPVGGDEDGGDAQQG